MREAGRRTKTDEAAIIGAQMISALSYCHGLKKVHLDLKPENILLTKALASHNASHTHVRICDFGLSKMVRKSDRTKDVILERYACGTPGFFAPEMILHEQFEGRRADMVSTRGKSPDFC